MIILAAVLVLGQTTVVGSWEGRIELDRKPDANAQVEKVYRELDSFRIALTIQSSGRYFMKVPRSMLGPAREETGNWFRTGFEIALMPKSKGQSNSNVLKVSNGGARLIQSLGSNGEALGKLVFTRKPKASS